MPRNQSVRRRWPCTPTLQLQHQRQYGSVDPMSTPPESPDASPAWSRKASLKPRHQPPYLGEYEYAPSNARDPSIEPVGHGHQFSYRPKRNRGPTRLSPRSSSASFASSASSGRDDDMSDSDAPGPSVDATPGQAPSGGDARPSDGEYADDSDSGSGSGFDSSSSQVGLSDEQVDASASRATGRLHAVSAAVRCELVIEDVDPLDSECEGLEVLFPTEVESARSRSHSRPRGLDRTMMKDLRNLHCGAKAASGSDGAAGELDADELAFLERQRELKHMRRVSMSSSIGKRTHSEMSESDDEAGGADVDDVGSSARRMRKRLHRGSLLFQDPPAPRIEELDEPDSCEEELSAEPNYAQELPYWTMEIIEAESS